MKKIKINWLKVIRNLLIVLVAIYMVVAQSYVKEASAYIDHCKNKIEYLEYVNNLLREENEDLNYRLELSNLSVEGLDLVEKSKFRVTAYCSCPKCCGQWATLNGGGITASGTRVKEGRTIAVCKSQIPFGTEVHIEGMGTYIAEDTGSAIKENCIDIYFDSHEEALNFGVKYLEVEW